MKDGISKVKSEIKGVMGIMQGNIAKVLDRGAKLEDLQDKSGMVYSMVSTVCADIHVMLLYALMMFTLLIGVWLAVMFLFLDNLKPKQQLRERKMLSDICRAVSESDALDIFGVKSYCRYLTDRQQWFQFNLFSKMDLVFTHLY